MLEALSRLATALLRHLFAYGELLREETHDALRLLRRRAIGLVLAAGAAGMSLLMGCVWLIAATWDGPSRVKAVAGLCLGFAALAMIGLWYAGTGLQPGKPRPFQRLREEWSADREQFEDLERRPPSSAGEPTDPGQASQGRSHEP